METHKMVEMMQLHSRVCFSGPGYHPNAFWAQHPKFHYVMGFSSGKEYVE
jgi:hypothetical protein